MWPWEHVAVGYIAYSLLHRGYTDRPPRAGAVLAVAFGSLFPDLVDKPLGWAFGVLPSISVGHSVFLAVPLGTLIVVVTGHSGRADVGVAFLVGHLLHIPGDIVYPLVLGGSSAPERFLWPLYSGTVADAGFMSKVVLYLTDFMVFLGTPRGRLYLACELVLVGTAITLWVADRLPVASDVLRWTREHAG